VEQVHAKEEVWSRQIKIKLKNIMTFDSTIKLHLNFQKSFQIAIPTA
jgi:hypothetical protein